MRIFSLCESDTSAIECRIGLELAFYEASLGLYKPVTIE